jgi:gas vesicle protein
VEVKIKMRKLLSLLTGLGLGAAFGAAMVLLFAPTSGEQLVANLKQGWQETLDEARKASEQRRLELEAQLLDMQKKRLPLP